jgi:hypothetical protein
MSQGEALDKVPNNFTEMSIDDKLNLINSQLIVLSRMVEDIVTHIYNAQSRVPNQDAVLKKYRQHVSEIMEKRGMDQNAIDFFNEFLNINFND